MRLSGRKLLPWPHQREELARVIAAFLLLAVATGLMFVAITTATMVEPPRAAPSGCATRVQARLFFGLSSPDGDIPEAAWDAFLLEVVTPRFPDGLTVLRANGQWRRAGEPPQREASRVLEIVYDDSPHAGSLINQIAAIYKERFRQESVLIVRNSADVCF